METFGYDYNHIIPHGSYLVNLANPDKYGVISVHDPV